MCATAADPTAARRRRRASLRAAIRRELAVALAAQRQVAAALDALRDRAATGAVPRAAVVPPVIRLARNLARLNHAALAGVMAATRPPARKTR